MSVDQRVLVNCVALIKTFILTTGLCYLLSYFLDNFAIKCCHQVCLEFKAAMMPFAAIVTNIFSLLKTLRTVLKSFPKAGHVWEWDLEVDCSSRAVIIK